MQNAAAHAMHPPLCQTRRRARHTLWPPPGLWFCQSPGGGFFALRCNESDKMRFGLINQPTIKWVPCSECVAAAPRPLPPRGRAACSRVLQMRPICRATSPDRPTRPPPTSRRCARPHMFHRPCLLQCCGSPSRTRAPSAATASPRRRRGRGGGAGAALSDGGTAAQRGGATRGAPRVSGVAIGRANALCCLPEFCRG